MFAHSRFSKTQYDMSRNCISSKQANLYILQGACIIRMLNEVLGNKVFFEGIHSYLSEYAYSNAVQQQLYDAVNEVCRSRDEIYRSRDEVCKSRDDVCRSINVVCRSRDELCRSSNEVCRSGDEVCR